MGASDADEPSDADGPGEPVVIDLKGLRCPLPALKLRAALRKLPPGARVTALTTDPLAGIDVPNLLRETGDRLEGTTREGEVTAFRVRRASP